MPKQVLAWKCRYCGVLKKTETIADRHEKSCLQNPGAKNCIICVHSTNELGEFGEPHALVCHIKGCGCSRAVSANCDDFKKKTSSVKTV